MSATPRFTGISRTSANSSTKSSRSNAAPSRILCNRSYSNNAPNHPLMIALKDNLPLVEFDSGHVVAFQRDWLLRSLSQAARKAGYQKWWLAEHVAESVTAYLMHNDETVITVPRLAESVQS